MFILLKLVVSTNQSINQLLNVLYFRILKVVVFIFIVVYIIVEVAIDRPENLIPAVGVVLYVVIFYVTSINPARVRCLLIV